MKTSKAQSETDALRSSEHGFGGIGFWWSPIGHTGMVGACGVPFTLLLHVVEGILGGPTDTDTDGYSVCIMLIPTQAIHHVVEPKKFN